MDAILNAIAERADATHLVLIAVIAAQQWQIRDLTKRVADAMDRLASTMALLTDKLPGGKR